jgi:hypothetical protein
MTIEEFKQWIVDRKKSCESSASELIQEHDNEVAASESLGMVAAFEEVLEKLRNEEIEG